MKDQAMQTDVMEAVEPVRRSMRVKASPALAFRVFTEEMDAWWPRTHHIGSSPMKRIVVERHEGGAICTEQEDGTLCPWGTVKVWQPPTRFVMYWQVSPEWRYEPDLERSSEVEVTFTPADDGTTLVELEHRHFERHGGAYATMRQKVSEAMGWGSLLEMFAVEAERREQAGV